MSDIIEEKKIDMQIFNPENRDKLVDTLTKDLTRHPAQDHWDIKEAIKKENKPAKEGLLTELLRKELDKINPKDNRTNAQHLVEKVVDHAAKGNAQFMSFIFDRVDGKQTERKEITVVKPMIVLEGNYKINDVKEIGVECIKEIPTGDAGNNNEIGTNKT